MPSTKSGKSKHGFLEDALSEDGMEINQTYFQVDDKQFAIVLNTKNQTDLKRGRNFKRFSILPLLFIVLFIFFSLKDDTSSLVVGIIVSGFISTTFYAIGCTLQTSSGILLVSDPLEILYWNWTPMRGVWNHNKLKIEGVQKIVLERPTELEQGMMMAISGSIGYLSTKRNYKLRLLNRWGEEFSLTPESFCSISDESIQYAKLTTLGKLVAVFFGTTFSDKTVIGCYKQTPENSTDTKGNVVEDNVVMQTPRLPPIENKVTASLSNFPELPAQSNLKIESYPEKVTIKYPSKHINEALMIIPSIAIIIPFLMLALWFHGIMESERPLFPGLTVSGSAMGSSFIYGISTVVVFFTAIKLFESKLPTNVLELTETSLVFKRRTRLLQQEQLTFSLFDVQKIDEPDFFYTSTTQVPGLRFHTARGTFHTFRALSEADYKWVKTVLFRHLNIDESQK